MKKRLPVLLALLALVLVAGVRPTQATAGAIPPITFMGKSYCPIKYDIHWPFTAPEHTITQGSGVVRTVAEAEKEAERSSLAPGAAMSRFQVAGVEVKVGDHVQDDQPLIYYQNPISDIIAEKEYLSTDKLDNLAASLADVEYRLLVARNKQNELKHSIAIQSAAPQTLRTTAQDIEILVLQREYLQEAYDLEKSELDNRMLISRSKFGKDFNPKKFPKKGAVRSPMDGYVLWMNSSLVPGMAFTKPADLITVGRLDPILIRAAVHEIEAIKLKVGDPVSLVFRAMPGHTYTTTIARINFVAQPAMMQQPSFYEVELSLANPDRVIKEGMRCDITVLPRPGNS